MSAALKIVHTETLESISCAECGAQIYLLEHFVKKRRDDHKGFYCPMGHNNYFPGKSEAEKLKEELEAQKRRTQMALDEARVETERRRKTEKKLERMKKRVAAGVCPVPECGRHFTNVERHVATKHPEFKKEAE